MARFKPHVFAQILANTEKRGDCMVWKGPYDEYGNPVHPTKRFKEATMIRQDVLVFEEAYPSVKVEDEEYLVHECGERGCLNPAHMKYLTDPAERAEHDRYVRSMAVRMFSSGSDIAAVMSATGLSWVRLSIIEVEASKLRVVSGSRN